MKTIQIIDQLQSDIFNYEVGAVPIKVSEIMTLVMEQNMADLSDAAKVQQFNQILQASLQAMQNKDYLLLADILEFELKRFIGN